MPLTIQLPDAADPIRRKYGRYFSEAERIFKFTENPVDFISNGIVSNDQFTSVLDGDPVVKHFQNMTINAGHTVTTTQRCKGMYLLIEGDLTVNGILSMTARGAKAAGKFVGIDPDYDHIYFNETDIFSQDIFTIGKVGGLASDNHNIPGTPGANNACAGGGCGIVEYTFGARGGKGGPGTSFSGGPGGGSSPRSTAGNGAIDGGAGGNGVAWFTSATYPAAGGAGSGGAGAGSAGTGGLVILIVKGNILFGPTGQIVSKGSKGGNGYLSGGGSGGGAIHIFHKGTISNPEKVTALGGERGNLAGPVAGSPGAYGFPGGNGSVSFNKI